MAGQDNEADQHSHRCKLEKTLYEVPGCSGTDIHD